MTGANVICTGDPLLLLAEVLGKLGAKDTVGAAAVCAPLTPSIRPAVCHKFIALALPSIGTMTSGYPASPINATSGDVITPPLAYALPPAAETPTVKPPLNWALILAHAPAIALDTALGI